MLISEFQTITNTLFEQFYDLKDTAILTAITAAVAIIFLNPVTSTLFVSAASFFATRVIKKMITLGFGSDSLDRFALVALRDVNYVHYVAVTVSIIASWFFPVIGMISASVCGIYCGLTFEVYRAHDIQSLRS